MKKRNLIIGGVFLLLLTVAAVFFAVNSLAAPNYPRGVADIKSGEVKVVFENLPTEYIEVKELYSLQYYMEKYPKAKEIMGYYKGTLYYWTKDERKAYYRYLKPDSGNVTSYTITIHYKDVNEIL